MNFLESIEGRGGEELTSAILYYLILRSQDIREKFVEVISSVSQVGPIEVKEHFSCQLEVFTEDGGLGAGRIDLLIETDDSIIGIENKIGANLTENKPLKYLPYLKGRAKDVGTLRGRVIRPLLILIVPENRKIDFSKINVDDPRILVILTWDKIFNELSYLRKELDPVTIMVLTSLQEYMNRKIHFIPKFVKKFPHYWHLFEKRGTPIQREMITKLWRFFPEGSARFGSGDTWVGYYFLNKKDRVPTDPLGWFGFVSKVLLEGENLSESELVVLSPFAMELPKDNFKPVNFKNKNWLGSKEVWGWIIRFTKEWATDHDWKVKLETPLKEAIRKLEEVKIHQTSA